MGAYGLLNVRPRAFAGFSERMAQSLAQFVFIRVAVHNDT